MIKKSAPPQFCCGAFSIRRNFMKCIINGRLVLADKTVDGMAIVFGEKIEKIAPVDELELSEYEVIDARGRYVAPGLVDIHIHGYLGEDVSDGTTEGIVKMAKGIAENGVTSWCPTTMTVSKGEIEAAFNAARRVKSSGEYYGARIIGVNAEGPFINESKKGAQAAEHILTPDADFIIDNADIVKLVTIAPEVDGALDAIKKISDDGRVTVSMGHTNATFEEASAGIEAGVRNTTHLFNAMTALAHRNPGVVGAALSNDEVACELIADTFHVSKGLFSLVSKIKGDKLCLITDCMRAGGMPDGDYTLGGQPVHKEGIKCLLPDGTIAGSVLRLNEAVYNLYSNTELPIERAVAAASLNPARVVGADGEIGSLEVGKRADIIIADDKFKVEVTVIGGEIRYERG